MRKALCTVGDPIRLSEAFETAPADLVRAAKEHSLEGIVAKLSNSLYEPGKRSGASLKYSLSSAATRPEIPLMARPEGLEPPTLRSEVVLTSF